MKLYIWNNTRRYGGRDPENPFFLSYADGDFPSPAVVPSRRSRRKVGTRGDFDAYREFDPNEISGEQ